jgi:hypothetical protein
VVMRRTAGAEASSSDNVEFGPMAARVDVHDGSSVER